MELRARNATHSGLGQLGLEGLEGAGAVKRGREWGSKGRRPFKISRCFFLDIG